MYFLVAATAKNILNTYRICVYLYNIIYIYIYIFIFIYFCLYLFMYLFTLLHFYITEPVEAQSTPKV